MAANKSFVGRVTEKRIEIPTISCTGKSKNEITQIHKMLSVTEAVNIKIIPNTKAMMICVSTTNRTFLLMNSGQN
jgi:hypothetical protein